MAEDAGVGSQGGAAGQSLTGRSAVRNKPSSVAQVYRSEATALLVGAAAAQATSDPDGLSSPLTPLSPKAGLSAVRHLEQQQQQQQIMGGDSAGPGSDASLLSLSASGAGWASGRANFRRSSSSSSAVSVLSVRTRRTSSVASLNVGSFNDAAAGASLSGLAGEEAAGLPADNTTLAGTTIHETVDEGENASKSEHAAAALKPPQSDAPLQASGGTAASELPSRRASGIPASGLPASASSFFSFDRQEERRPGRPGGEEQPSASSREWAAPGGGGAADEGGSESSKCPQIDALTLKLLRKQHSLDNDEHAAVLASFRAGPEFRAFSDAESGAARLGRWSLRFQSPVLEAAYFRKKLRALVKARSLLSLRPLRTPAVRTKK